MNEILDILPKSVIVISREQRELLGEFRERARALEEVQLYLAAEECRAFRNGYTCEMTFARSRQIAKQARSDWEQIVRDVTRVCVAVPYDLFCDRAVQAWCLHVVRPTQQHRAPTREEMYMMMLACGPFPPLITGTDSRATEGALPKGYRERGSKVVGNQ